MTIPNSKLGINSVCSNSFELLASDDFKRGLNIILKKTKNEDTGISEIFEKLASEGDILPEVRISPEQKEILYKFVREPEVVVETKKLLQHLTTQNLPAGSKSLSEGHQEYTDFMELMTNITGITSDNGYAALTGAIGEVADKSLHILNIKKDATLSHVIDTNVMPEHRYGPEDFLDILEQFYHATDQSDLIETDLPVIQEFMKKSSCDKVSFFYERGRGEESLSGYRITTIDPGDNPSGNLFKGILVDKKGKIIDQEDKLKWLV